MSVTEVLPLAPLAPAAGPRSRGLLGGRADSLVVTPAVVGHRGASGYRPEHTLEAYRTAIRMGVDDVELDLVLTADGVLLARHENELSLTTDVAEHAALADRRTTRVVDGREVTGWFAEDLTAAEVATLRARERSPRMRPHSAAYDGREGVPTLDDVLAAVAEESARLGRSVGVMIELKHCAHLEARGLSVVEPLLEVLARHGLDHPRSRVTVMSFEVGVLRRLAPLTRLPLLQLVDRLESRPPDLAAAGEPTTYGDLVTAAGLAEVDTYADGLGVHKELVLPRDEDGTTLGASDLVRAAHRRWLTVHVYTVRAENRFLPVEARLGDDPDARGDVAAEARALLDAGVDGLICDQPEDALAVRDARV
ncbi:glycerophosphodiester phosphodiesterase family protein [uncultured Nocardioides sp.]|uniref:glycerophosphodiester phosphodiesterase family protein n=1 Tax=uncultured Nocardioides sp. TaxID=198441 RepID=UPI002629C7C8|nr:glycerophosphodiester phosphodiesterase family protein [uncultured Nocardioides sp.]